MRGAPIMLSIQVSSAYKNGGHGISGAQACTVNDSTALENGMTGIHADGPGVVSHSTARGNGQNGIVGRTVSNCEASYNVGNGIQVSSGMSYGYIFENTCLGNGSGGDGAGILAAAGNRIEGNSVIDNDRGDRPPEPHHPQQRSLERIQELRDRGRQSPSAHRGHHEPGRSRSQRQSGAR